MQGQRSSASNIVRYPANPSVFPGSTSSDAGLDSQVSWSSTHSSAQNQLSEDGTMPSHTNIQYLQHVWHEGQNTRWLLGETSSPAAQYLGDQNERKTDNARAFRSSILLDEPRNEPSNILSLNNVQGNSNSNQTMNSSLLLQNSPSDSVPQDLNLNSVFEDEEDDDCQIIEPPISFISNGSSNVRMQPDSFGVPSGFSGHLMHESDGRPGCSLGANFRPCKRKAIAVDVGESSGAGRSNCFHDAERSLWHAGPAAQIVASNSAVSTPTEHGLVINPVPQRANPRLRIGVGGSTSSTPLSLNISGDAENSQRNSGLLTNDGQRHQRPISRFYSINDAGNRDVAPSSQPSRSVLRHFSFESNPAPALENGRLHGQSQPLHMPTVHSNPQSGWNGASSSRTSSAAPSVVPEDIYTVAYEETTPRNISRSISEHPMFLPTGDIGNSSQNPTNWNLAGGNNNVAGNAASTPLARSSMGVNSTAPTWSRRSFPQYPRRLSEIVRRSLLSSAGTEFGGESSNHAARLTSATSQNVPLSSVPENRLRSALLERHHDGTFGIPYSLRTFAAASEGRSSIMSEQIRQVLDLMRRGEGVMVLDHSVLVGMADIHDQHRDMRLDVDNMSYEELLALEERIGNVCTGLSEETIMSLLKQRKYRESRTKDQTEKEPCSICRDDYKRGEDLGILDCGHIFHRDCIKQWLVQKNLCPICKTTGLTT